MQKINYESYTPEMLVSALETKEKLSFVKNSIALMKLDVETIDENHKETYLNEIKEIENRIKSQEKRLEIFLF